MAVSSYFIMSIEWQLLSLVKDCAKKEYWSSSFDELSGKGLACLTLHYFCRATDQIWNEGLSQRIVAYDWNRDPCDPTSRTKRLITRVVFSLGKTQSFWNFWTWGQSQGIASSKSSSARPALDCGILHICCHEGYLQDSLPMKYYAIMVDIYITLVDYYHSFNF